MARGTMGGLAAGLRIRHRRERRSSARSAAAALAVVCGLLIACGKGQGTGGGSQTLPNRDAGSGAALQVASACPLPYRTIVDRLTTWRVPFAVERSGGKVQLAFWGAWAPLSIESVWFGRYQGGGEVADPVQVTFDGGETRAEMPIGTPGLSDFFAYEVRAGERYAVSFSATGAVPEGLRFESDGVFALGDVAAEPVIAGSLDYVTHAVRWIAIQGPAQPVLAVLGDSIGAGESAARVEDRFFERAQRSVGFPIVDASVGGDGIERALGRIERDVLALPGVTDCLVQVGTNDLHREDPDFLIDGLNEAYERLRHAGIRPWAATIIPKGPGHLTAEAEQMRQTVNEFVRNRAQVQGVVDFDASVRDPAAPSLPLPGMLADGIHPTSAGHAAMADALVRALRTVPRP